MKNTVSSLNKRNYTKVNGLVQSSSNYYEYKKSITVCQDKNPYNRTVRLRFNMIWVNGSCICTDFDGRDHIEDALKNTDKYEALVRFSKWQEGIDLKALEEALENAVNSAEFKAEQDRLKNDRKR